MSLKEQAASIGKKFIAEAALEFNHEAAVSAVKGLFRDITPEILRQYVRGRKSLGLENSVLEWLFSHKGYITEYSAKSLAVRFAELLDEARPDLIETLVSLGDDGNLWFYKNIEMIRDKVINPERFMEEMEKPLSVSVTCTNCGKSIRVLKEDFESMKSCPFCGAGKEE